MGLQVYGSRSKGLDLKVEGLKLMVDLGFRV